MKRDLKIGEFAKLMDVSTHQLRYFEEKDLLTPSYIDENGYRMYDLSKIYELYHILLLRDLDIPVSKIKNLFINYSRSEYIGTLEKSVANIEKKIRELEKLRDSTNRLIKKAAKDKGHDEILSIKHVKKRNLLHLGSFDYDFSNDARLWYDIIQSTKEIKSIFDCEFITLYSDTKMDLYIINDINLNYTLDSGEYLTYQFLLDSQSNMKDKIGEFFRYASENDIALEDRLIEVEDNDISMLYDDKLHVELQMKIK